MKQGVSLTVAAIAATVLATSCRNSDSEFEPPVLPKKVAFEGQIDSQYAGTWKTAHGESIVQLAKDGSLTVDTTSFSVKGKSVVHVTGKWLATKDALLFSYVSGNQPAMVLRYGAKLAGDSLTLTQGQIKTTYARK